MAYKFQLGTAILSGSIESSDDNSFDLGSSTNEYKNLFLDGTANIDSLVADTADIDGGTIDGAAIGSASPSTAVFTTVSGSSAAQFASLRSDSVDINGGAIDGTVIGANSVANGSFAAVVATSLDVNGAGDVSDTLTLSKGSGTALSVSSGGLAAFNGSVDLGGATSDTITATGRFDSDLVPSSDDTRDLGASTLKWKDLYLDGVAYVDDIHAADCDINGGAIDGTVIGAASAAAGTFAALQGTVVTATSAFTGSISGSLVQGTMANFGFGGLSTSDGGSIESAGGVSAVGAITGSSTLEIGGTVRLDGAASLAAVSVDLTADSFYMLDDTDKLMKKVAMTDYASKIAGNAISVSNGVLAVNPDANGGLEIRSGFDSLQIKAGGVTNAMLAGSIANAKLSNSSVSYGGVSLSLGQSDATPAFDLSDATAYPGDNNLVTVGALGAGSISSGFGNIDIGTSTLDAGVTTVSSLTASYARITELDVVTINSISQTEETLEVSDKLIVSALSASSANSDGGGLRIGGGAHSNGHASVLYDHANTGLDFNIGGSTIVSLDAAAFEPVASGVDLGASGAKFEDLYIDGIAYLDAINLNGTAISATAGEINLLDAGVGSSVALEATDAFIMFDDDAGDVAKKVKVQDMADFVGENIAEKITTATHASAHSHVFATHGSILIADASGGAVTINLPAVGTGNDGKTLKIKKVGSNDVTINRGGTDSIDGLNTIKLDSDNAAISLIFDNVNNRYHVL